MDAPITRAPDTKAPPRACYSVAEFCEAHRISRSHFYDLLRRGSGPRVFKCGHLTLVSVEAAREWRERLEAATAATMGAAA